MTRVRQDEDEIHDYFMIRHLMARRTGGRHGLIVTAFTTHDLYGVQPKSLRTDCDLQLFLETPANPHDERLLLDLLGEEIYRSLQEVEKRRQEQPEYKGWIAYAVKWDKGLTYIPKSNFNLSPRSGQGQGQTLGAGHMIIQQNIGAGAIRGTEPGVSGEGQGQGLGPFHELLLALVWKGYTSLKDIEEKLFNVHPDEIQRGLEELEDMGYLRLQGPRSRILSLLFHQDWLLTSRGVDYATRRGGKIQI
jgi:hypothetical protein